MDRFTRTSLKILLCILLLFFGRTLRAAEPPQKLPASPKAPWGEFNVIEEREPHWFMRALLWIPNRVVDFYDIFRVDVGVGPAIGGVVRASRYVQGGVRVMAPTSLRIGALGRQTPVILEGTNELGVSPFFQQSRDRLICAGEVGLGVDLILISGYAGLCLDEFVDFWGGIIGYDIKNDEF